MRDMIPPKRSIRNIPIDRAKKETQPLQESHDENTNTEEAPVPPRRPRRPRNRALGYRRRSRMPKVLGLIIGGVLVIIIVFFVLSAVFAGATVTVTPREAEISVDGTFTARTEPEIGELAFDVISVEKEVSREVNPTGEELIERPASGNIVVFNDFSEKEQRLINNTRFETPEGLIYRIPESIVVPGQYEKDGETLPGSIEVTVYADSPGEEYNIPLS